MSTHEIVDPSWPRQVRLPGQTAAHPGPVDMTMMYVMHHAFRRDLADFVAAAEATPVDDRESWSALLGRWELFARALHHHHGGEDAGLWPLLAERATDQERAVLESMAAEHSEIDPILESCTTGFARLADTPDEGARAALAVRVVAARESLGRHLRHEETEAIAIVQRVMDAREWDRLEQEHFRDGMALREVAATVPWALEAMPGAVRRQLFAQPGGRVHQLLWLLTRRGFLRRGDVAFRHVDRAARAL